MSGEKIYYKLSNYDSYKGIVGHECVNEIIVDRLLSILGVEHLQYELFHADIMIEDKIYNTYLCASKDFKEKGDSKIALDAFYQVERLENESPMEFCIRHGLSLLFQCLRDEDCSKVDVMEDKRVQCFVGSNSAMENLKLIPTEKLPVFHTLKETDQSIIL